MGAAAAAAAAAAASGARKVMAMTMLKLPKSLAGGLTAAILASGIAQAEPQAFDTPQAAADAVIAALKAKDARALLAVFGPENEDVVFTGDVPSDRVDWSLFL